MSGGVSSAGTSNCIAVISAANQWLLAKADSLIYA